MKNEKEVLKNWPALMSVLINEAGKYDPDFKTIKNGL